MSVQETVVTSGMASPPLSLPPERDRDKCVSGGVYLCFVGIWGAQAYEKLSVLLRQGGDDGTSESATR